MRDIKRRNLIIADSQFLVVEALKTLIEADGRLRLAGVARNKGELYNLLKDFRSAVLIVDLANIDFQGIEEFKKIRKKYSRISIVILTNSITNVEFTTLTRLGIGNIVYKTARKEEIIRAIDAALKGEPFYSDEISALPVFDKLIRSGVQMQTQLTDSEFEIVKLIALGMTTRKIANQKEISYHTVNTHRKNILKKTEVSNSSELILHAIKSGWIENMDFSI